MNINLINAAQNLPMVKLSQQLLSELNSSCDHDVLSSTNVPGKLVLIWYSTSLSVCTFNRLLSGASRLQQHSSICQIDSAVAWRKYIFLAVLLEIIERNNFLHWETFRMLLPFRYFQTTPKSLWIFLHIDAITAVLSPITNDFSIWLLAERT